MMLNSQELLKIITYVDNPKCIQQVGIDLELIEVSQLEGRGQILLKETRLPNYRRIETTWGEDQEIGWLLEPGYYEVFFKQGCNIPNNVTLKIRQRSSLLRIGGQLHSSIFDPGFETKSIGTFIQICRPVFIQEGARIAQIYGHYNSPVSEENLYNGQFQRDKQKIKNI